MKKIILSFSLMLFSSMGFAQNVNIPDANFKKALVDFGIDKNNDGQIQYSEAATPTILFLDNKGISDLTGIEAFVNLQNLQCANNNISKLDLSKNPNVYSVNCALNKISSLNVTGLISLKRLDCFMNLISNLDLTSNVNLQKLSASDNKITQLDVSKNVNLTDIDVSGNQLVTLNLSKNPNLKNVLAKNNKLTALSVANGNNAAITTMRAGGNSGLTCVQIDKGFTPPSDFDSGWYVDSTASYSYSTCAKLSTINFNKQSLKLVNPVKDNLIIKGDAKVEMVEIYSATGQLVKVLVNNNTNVSRLEKGIYLVKITTNNGVINNKIIKE